MQIFVIGMHRSGTSMVARLLNLMGAYFGPEGISTGSGQENPKGFWERKDVRALNNQILYAANSDWDRVSDFSLEKIASQDLDTINQQLQRLILELDAHRPWFLKEPRFCLTFPLWKKYLEYPICIHTHRSPIQIAQSLKSRNGFPLHFGIALWEKYALESLKVAHDCPQLLLSHAKLIQQPISVVTTLHQQLSDLGCQGIRIPCEQEILAFISPKLYRERGNIELESGFINQQQAQLINLFESENFEERALEFTALDLSPGAREILHAKEVSTQQQATLQVSLRNSDHALHEIKKIEHKLTQENQHLQTALHAKKLIETDLRHESRRLKTDLKQKTVDLKQKTADIKQLQYWMSQFSKNTEATLQSWRWKTGDFLVRLVEIALLRPKSTLASDHLRALVQQFRAWRQPSQISKSPDPRSSPQAEPTSSTERTLRQSIAAGGRATVIVCVHNAPAEVRACLESIGRYTNLRCHELILIDDGSNAPTQRLVVEYAAKLGAKTVRNETALGYTKAANQGLRKAQGDYCLLLNSDTLVTPGWLDCLIRCASSHPRTACVGPLSNAASWQSIPNLKTDSGEWQVNELPETISLDEYARLIAMRSSRLYPQVPFINGFCYLITRESLNQLGYLDEDTFPRGYGEEDDFSVRAQNAGWALRIADDCYVYHAKSKSFTSQVRTEITATTKVALQAKHGKSKIDDLLQKIQHNEPLLISRTLAKIATHSQPDKLSITSLDIPDSATRPTLHIGWVQPHLKVVGGIRRAIEMTNRLVALGFRTTLITPHGEKTDWLPISAQVIDTNDAKSIRFDVLIVSDPDVYPFFSETAADLRINYHLAPYHLYRNPDKNLERYYRDSSDKNPIHHVANSKWTADNAESAHKIHNEGIFPGGIDPYLFFPHNEEKVFDVVFYGSDRPHKGTATILSATSDLRTLSLATLDAQQDDLARHISKGRVFASACWHEGFNFCPLEAMACGVPVAMTDDGGSREYAVDRENALVVPVNDAQALREAIHEALENIPLRLRLIENGLWTASRYTWDRVTTDFAALILKLHRQDIATGLARRQ